MSEARPRTTTFPVAASPGSCDGLLRRAEAGARLCALSAELNAHEELWRTIAFREPALPWETAYRGLATALRALSLETADALHADPRAAGDWLARWLPVTRWRALAAVGAWPRHALRPWPREFQRDVPGRKWAQIEAFAAAVRDGGHECIDWCAGKGHLARAVSQQWNGRVVAALERDHALVAAGAQLARRARLPVTPRVCDVVSDAVMPWLGAPRHALALHACGALHLRLLRAGAAARLPAISCAPCCYHLGAQAGQLVVSSAALVHAPRMRPEDLRTAVQETVTAPAHARRHRRQVQRWQLGFDLLQREARGVDAYLPLPPIDAAALAGSFAGWCRALAEQRQIALPAALDFARFERAGAERFRLVTALDLVRHQFRRPLELWLVLDRALYLAEQGYRVEVGEFCAREVSPRNLLIDARL
ncbi:MAG: SAM-dependent methyltransferase [Pseudomonadales bacterium]|jgi:hypothetical protein|nr:SAM-dependent methyltransferase [Pseudomonadales bacterium]